jgi:hypothetical protein
MLYEYKQIPELNDLKHRNDDNKDYVPYQDRILTSTTSPYMYNNDLMNGFLLSLQRLVSLLFDQHNVVKNFRNYLVDKDYYQHNK